MEPFFLSATTVTYQCVATHVLNCLERFNPSLPGDYDYYVDKKAEMHRVSFNE